MEAHIVEVQAEATGGGHERSSFRQIDERTADEAVAEEKEGIDERSPEDGKARADNIAESELRRGEEEEEEEEEITTVEKLKRHRRAMAGRVWVPEMWGQERLLREWSDCHAFDRVLFPRGLMTAREALVGECRRADSGVLLRSNPT